MTVSVANTAIGDTFESWRVRTNEVAHALTTKVVSTDSNTATGNAAISGTFTSSKLQINGTSPTINFVDSDGASGFIHVNASQMYFLPGANNSTSWTQIGSGWPLVINLTNNNAAFANTVTATTFSGALSATNLTGTIADARLPTTQTGKTFTSAVTLQNGTLTIGPDLMGIYAGGTWIGFTKSDGNWAVYADNAGNFTATGTIKSGNNAVWHAGNFDPVAAADKAAGDALAFAIALG